MLRGIACLVIMMVMASVTAVAQAVDIVFVIDTSGSISAAELALEIGGLQDAVNNLLLPAVTDGVTINVGVVCFSTDVQTLLPLTPLNTNTVVTINGAIGNATSCTRGRTNMGDALNKAIAVLTGGTAPQKVINLVADSAPNEGPDPVAIANYFKATSGNEIWSLGVSVSATARAVLQALAGPPPAGYFEAIDFTNFKEAESEKIRRILSPIVGFPSLSKWGMIILVTLFIGISIAWMMRRRMVGNVGGKRG